MSAGAYELAALAMRYFFAAIMALIVIRAWKITVVDSRRASELRRMSPETGLTGEFLVVSGDSRAKTGMRYPVIREGMIGSSGKADVRLRTSSVRRSHAFFELTQEGLRLDCIGRARIEINDRLVTGAVLRDGAHVRLGRVELMLILNAPVAAPITESDEEDDGDDMFMESSTPIPDVAAPRPDTVTPPPIRDNPPPIEAPLPKEERPPKKEIPVQIPKGEPNEEFDRWLYGQDDAEEPIAADNWDMWEEAPHESKKKSRHDIDDLFDV